LVLGLLLAGLLVPAAAGAFSFGSFAPNENILSIQLSASNMPPTVSYDGTSILTFSASVSRIETDLAIYDITIGDVLFDSQVMLNSESVTAPIAPIPLIGFPGFGGQISATFINGLAADITITDVGPGGSGQLLAADYDVSLAFSANSPLGYGTPVTGSVIGDFTLDLGTSDASFEAAFGSAGRYFSNLTDFTSGGAPVGSDLCNLITPTCADGQSLDDFVVNPTATITRTGPVVPEPSPSVLWGMGLAGLLMLVARRR
jgi:MYXO-CTERM domain-containing protein